MSGDSDREVLTRKVSNLKKMVKNSEYEIKKLQASLKAATETSYCFKLELQKAKEAVEIFDTCCSVCGVRINSLDECGCEWSK